MEQAVGLCGTKIPIYEIRIMLCEFEARLLEAASIANKVSPDEYAKIATLQTLTVDVEHGCIVKEIGRILKVAEDQLEETGKNESS